MAINLRRTMWVWVPLVGLVLTISLLAIQWWPRWREFNVYEALHSSNSPAFWWPPEWRRELRTSFLLEGEVKNPKSGTLELVSETQGQVFRTTVANGHYSFSPQRLPASPFKVRVLFPEGSSSGWLQMETLDPGLHRINLSF